MSFMRNPNDPIYRDPNDPNDPQRKYPIDDATSANATWGWVAAAVFVAVILFIAFSSGNQNVQTAANMPATQPTITAPNASAPAASPTTPAPAMPTPSTPAPAPAPSGN